MNCTYCQKELNSYKKSAEIPGQLNWHYIVCNCGNVMKAEIVSGSINVIQNTTTAPGPEAIQEILMAKNLFEKAGLHVNGYSVDNPNRPNTAKEIEEMQQVKEKEVYFAPEPEKSPAAPIEPPRKEKRSFMVKIRDFCKKLF